MPKRLLQKYSNLILSGWIVILIDILLLDLSIFLSNLFRFDFVLSDLERFHFFSLLLTVTFLGCISFFLTGSHRGIIRHTGQYDIIRIFKAVTLTVILIALINYMFNLLRVNSPPLAAY